VQHHDRRAGPPRGGMSASSAAEMLDPALVDRVRATLVEQGSDPTPARVAAALRGEQRVLGQAEVLSAVTVLRSELAGTGVLEPLLRRPGVTDVLVNGVDEVWVDDGAGLRRTGVRFAGESEVRRLAVRLATAAGRRLDDANPYVDVRLRDGTRLHAVLPPISPGGTCLSLRVPSRRDFSLADLVAAGSVSGRGALWLQAIVEARLAFLISGGTGSGKTTLLSCLLSLVAADDRLLLVEDSGELRPDHGHVVRLEARAPNVEGVGEITLRDLVRQALRMRPDRLVIGEVRGAEVADLLAALNTGHEGGCGTVHANSAGDVPARLEALGLAAGLRRDALHSQLAAGLDAVIHLERDETGRRVVREICVLVRGPDGLVAAEPAVVLRGDRIALRAGEPTLRARLSRGRRVAA
jgi:pilus assembly protein CpaF